MTRTINIIVPALVLAAFVPLAGQTTGRLAGKITDKDGNPIKDVQVVVKRTDINWSKTLVTDANGVFAQVGLPPKEFEVSYTHPAFVAKAEMVKVAIGDTVTRNVQLFKPGEAGGGKTATPQVSDEGAKLESEGLNLFNDNLELYRQGKFAEAMGPFESAYQALKGSYDKTTDEKAKEELKPKLDQVGRLLGLTYFQVGKKDQAEPLLLSAVERKADDQNALIALTEIYKAKKDAPNETKYRTMLEKLTGPNPEAIYNKAAEAFNAGKNREAREYVDEALRLNPKHADGHYLLALLHLGDGHMAPARAALLKYLELAPNGKKAGEVKEILKGIPK